MLGNLQVTLQFITDLGRTMLLLAVSVCVALLCCDSVNSASAATPSATSSVSKQACQPNGCIFFHSSKLYLFIRLMEFRDITINDSTITLDTGELSRDFTVAKPKLTTTDSSMNFTYSYGDEKKFFNISFIFWMDVKRSNWSLVMVSYVASDEHYEYNGEDYYYYEGEESYDEEYYDEYNVKDNDTMVIHKFPFHVGTSKATAYTCDTLAGLSNNSVGDPELHIYDFTMLPFNADENRPPDHVSDCRTIIVDKDNYTGLILGVIAGVAVVVAVVIVISTYLYRRRRRGKYDLLR